MAIKLSQKLKIVAITVLMFAMIFTNSDYIYANDIDILSKSAILMDVDTGKVLYEKEAYIKRQIASVSKIMTALLVIEEGHLDNQVYITAESARVAGTSFKIEEGMLISKRDLLHSLLYISGNDAGDALARSSYLGYDGFISKMNAKSSQLGLVNTRFFDPHGLGSYNIAGAGNNYSTAYDLAIIMKAAMNNPEFAAIQQKGLITTGNPNYPVLKNNNDFMKQYQGATGAKTGYTGNAGNCIVVMANRNGKNLIGVILAAPKGMRDKEIATLMDYGFNGPYNKIEVLPKEQPVITNLPATNNVLTDLIN